MQRESRGDGKARERKTVPGNLSSGVTGLALHRDEKVIPALAAGETGGMTYQTRQKPLLAAVRPIQPLELSYKDCRFGGRVFGVGDEYKGLALVSCF